MYVIREAKKNTKSKLFGSNSTAYFTLEIQIESIELQQIHTDDHFRDTVFYEYKWKWEFTDEFEKFPKGLISQQISSRYQEASHCNKMR